MRRCRSVPSRSVAGRRSTIRNGTQFAGIALGAIGVAVTLRGIYHGGGALMIVPGACLALAGLVLIFRGHYLAR